MNELREEHLPELGLPVDDWLQKLPRLNNLEWQRFGTYACTELSHETFARIYVPYLEYSACWYGEFLYVEIISRKSGILDRRTFRAPALLENMRIDKLLDEAADELSSRVRRYLEVWRVGVER